MHLRPAPTIFDLDERGTYALFAPPLRPQCPVPCRGGADDDGLISYLADAQVLIPLLYRLTASDSLPILLIGGSPVGSVDAIRELDASGELKKRVTEAGAVVDGAKRKKGRRS